MKPIRLENSKKPNKYRNKRIDVAGITFDSKAEAARWTELQMLERLQKIVGLCRQVPIVLIPGAKLWGADRARPAWRLVVDFHYVQDGVPIWDDAKGFETAMSLAKRHAAKALHGIDVRLSKGPPLD